MASSTKKTQGYPHRTGSIIDYFTSLRLSVGSEVTLRTSDVKPQRLKRLRKTGGVDKFRKKYTSGPIVNAASSSSENMGYKPSADEYVDFISNDAALPVSREPSLSNRPGHQDSSLSSPEELKDRECTKSIYSKPISGKRTPFLSQTSGWRKTNRSIDDPISDCCQDKMHQHLLLLKLNAKSTQDQYCESSHEGICVAHKEQPDETQIPQRNHQPKKAERTNTQVIDRVDLLPTQTLLSGQHVLQKPYDNFLWSLPWPTSPLLRNLRGSFPARSSSVPYHTQCDICPVTTQSTLHMDRQRRSGWRKDLSEGILRQLLEEIKVANPLFPAQRFFTVLSRKRLEHEKAFANQEFEGNTCSPEGPDHCLRGKRKWRLEGISPGGSPKRRRPNPRPEEKPVVESDSSAGPSLAISNHGPRRLVCQSRLSRTRRHRQQQENTGPFMASDVTMNLRKTTGNDIENIALQFHGPEFLQEDVLWTEKYQPQHSTEVVGNPARVKKLHNWLREWKLRADKEECRQKKEEMQKEKSKESWDSGDFEGELVVEDGEFELCNALLITGPHGIGKTAAVYACAQELGFKVFEVNASSQRSGRLLLSQLKEATQSHQVGTLTATTLKPAYFTSHSTPGCSAKPVTPPVAGMANSSRKVSTLTQRPLSALRKNSLRRGNSKSVDLTHFFQKWNKSDNTNHSRPNHIQHGVHTVEPNNEMNKEKGFPSKQAIDEGNHSVTRPGRSTLMSLILFEEVDVIFSEDVGFISAIKTFMSTTKRPVVLTTTDPLFGGTFDGHLEELHFKKPSLKVICSYLQLVCLVENVRTDPRDICSLWATHKGDIRQGLLQLQFWVRSGGGPAASPLLYHPVGVRVPQDPPNVRASPQPQEEAVKRSRQSTDLVAYDADRSGTPQECLDKGAVQELARLFKVRTWTMSENRRCSEVLSESQQRGVDLLYLNMEALIPLSTILSPNRADYLKEVSDPGLNGDIKAKELPEPSGIIDQSLGERLASSLRKRRCLSLKEMRRFKSNSQQKTVLLHQPKEEWSHHTAQSGRRTERHSVEKRASALVSRCLDSLTGFLDNLSFLDCCLQIGHVTRTGHCTPGLLFVRTRAELKDGMLDEPREDQEQEKEQMWGHRASELRAAVEGMSFRGCCQELEPAMERAQKLGEELGTDQWKQVLEQLSLPPPPHRCRLLSSQPLCHSDTAAAERRADIIKTVLSSKTFSRLGSSQAVITDYLPCLRTICRSESQQKDMAKHRFSHYLKNIQTGLSKSTMQQLSTDFP